MRIYDKDTKQNRGYSRCSPLFGTPFTIIEDSREYTGCWRAVMSADAPYRWGLLFEKSYAKLNAKGVHKTKYKYYETAYIFYSQEEAILWTCKLNNRQATPTEAKEIWLNHIAGFID